MSSEAKQSYDPNPPASEPELSRNHQETSQHKSDSNNMQVAQKESSSGFMLLSIKHQSKLRKDKQSQIISEKPRLFDEYFDDSCIGKSSLLELESHANKRSSCEFARQFSSTASLDAEEYDDDDDDDDEEDDENDASQLSVHPSNIQPTPIIMPLQTNVVHLTQVIFLFIPLIEGISLILFAIIFKCCIHPF